MKRLLKSVEGIERALKDINRKMDRK